MQVTVVSSVVAVMTFIGSLSVYMFAQFYLLSKLYDYCQMIKFLITLAVLHVAVQVLFVRFY